jgi:hypothetical protein
LVDKPQIISVSRHLFDHFDQLVRGAAMKNSAARGEVTGKAGTSGGLMTQRAVAEFFGGVSIMIIWRWRHDPAMAFPEGIEINGRRYFRQAEILDYRPPSSSPPIARPKNKPGKPKSWRTDCSHLESKQAIRAGSGQAELVDAGPVHSKFARGLVGKPDQQGPKKR